ncbi:MAG: rhomboid family intramembrane serine protease [Saprospiraceae bacterium]|nr:rhomboid family intramembrane serine protease [Saprospiraceae bacterium]MBK8111643.1 rhomboid family intramembrane serine protease [Saprospiraceae bacterium]
MNRELRYIYLKLRFSLLVAGIMTVTMVLQEYYHLPLAYYGIYPRHTEGLWGILFAPFLHSSWGHFFSNFFPIIALLFLMETFYNRVSLLATLGISFLTGVLVWLFARHSFHIGASGVVYGLISFLFWSGIFRGNRRSIILSLVVLTAYSSYFDGMQPREGISWESHLYGALAGVFFAFALKNIKEEGEEVDKDDYQQEKTPFLLPDTFVYTRAQRAAIIAEEMRRQEELRRAAEEGFNTL